MKHCTSSLRHQSYLLYTLYSVSDLWIKIAIWRKVLLNSLKVKSKFDNLLFYQLYRKWKKNKVDTGELKTIYGHVMLPPVWRWFEYSVVLCFLVCVPVSPKMYSIHLLVIVITVSLPNLIKMHSVFMWSESNADACVGHSPCIVGLLCHYRICEEK